MKEADLQREILQWLKSKDFLVFKMPLGGMKVRGGLSVKNPMKGFPDILGFFNDGTAFVIEVKMPKGRLSREQAEWLRILETRNVNTLVARSLGDVIKAFQPYLHLARGKSKYV